MQQGTQIAPARWVGDLHHADGARHGEFFPARTAFSYMSPPDSSSMRLDLQLRVAVGHTGVPRPPGGDRSGRTSAPTLAGEEESKE